MLSCPIASPNARIVAGASAGKIPSARSRR